MKKANDDPDKTLAEVEKQKAEGAPSPERDRGGSGDKDEPVPISNPGGVLMNAIRWLGMTTLALSAALLAGCGGGETPQSAASGEKATQDTEVQASLAGLAPEDRQAAEAQKVCPVTGEELGGMGVPVKVTVKDQPVFLCCKSCREEGPGRPRQDAGQGQGTQGDESPADRLAAALAASREAPPRGAAKRGTWP